MATRQEDPYAEDFYAWTQDQAEVLRRLVKERRNGPLDLAHLAEEVEDSGNEVRNAVRSRLRRLMEHLLKLEQARATVPRLDWMRTIANGRAEIADRLAPTIRRDIEPTWNTCTPRRAARRHLRSPSTTSWRVSCCCPKPAPTPWPSSSMRAAPAGPINSVPAFMMPRRGQRNEAKSPQVSGLGRCSKRN